MNQKFSELVDEVRRLDIEEKIEMVGILEKSIAESGRMSLYEDYIRSRKEKHTFGGSVGELKSMMDEK